MPEPKRWENDGNVHKTSLILLRRLNITTFCLPKPFSAAIFNCQSNNKGIKPLNQWHISHKAIHHNKMAHASPHHKQMENLMGTKIFMPGIENRQLEGVNNAPYGIDNPSGQQPAKCLGRKGSDNLRECQHAYPAHSNI